MENVVVKVSCSSASNGMVTSPEVNASPLPSKKPLRVCPSRVNPPNVATGREVPELMLKVAPCKQGEAQLDPTEPAGASPAPRVARKFVPCKSNADETYLGGVNGLAIAENPPVITIASARASRADSSSVNESAARIVET